MRRLLAAALLLLPAACTADDPPPPDGVRPCPREVDAALGAWAAAGFSGSVAVATGERLDCVAAYGSADDAAGVPNTTETVFNLGSVTKAFTAVAVHRLAAEGRLALDDRAGALLPELRGPVREATVRQLLLHTSGLNGTHGDDSEPLSRAAALTAIGELELAARPGERYLYSNAGYTLLAMIVEEVSGTGYRDYLATRILPLPDGRRAGGFWAGEPKAPGPRAVGYLEGGGTGEPGDLAGPYWAVEGNGGLAMTMRDLAAWTHAHFTTAGAVPRHDLGDGRAEVPGWAVFDASRFGQPFLAAAGGGGDVGHNAVVVWLPGARRTIAIASNKPKIPAERLLEAVGPALAKGEPLPTPSGGAGRDDLDAAAGEYRLDSGGAYQVTVREGGLAVAATGADAVAALFPPPAGVSGDDLRRHEEAVRELLAGRTREGREEREAFESAFGPIEGVALAGTAVTGGEPRTYVTITGGGRAVLGWYALNEAGGVEAAEVPAQPPTLRLLPSGEGRYHPDDPAGAGPAVTVTFAGDVLTVAGPAGPATARRAG